jgi:hypothetical protein
MIGVVRKLVKFITEINRRTYSLSWNRCPEPNVECPVATKQARKMYTEHNVYKLETIKHIPLSLLVWSSSWKQLQDTEHLVQGSCYTTVLLKCSIVKDIGNFGWRSMECWGLSMWKARRVTVKELLFYSLNWWNWGPTAKSIIAHGTGQSVVYF